MLTSDESVTLQPEYWMTAAFPAGNGPDLRTPIATNTTVTVL